MEEEETAKTCEMRMQMIVNANLLNVRKEQASWLLERRWKKNANRKLEIFFIPVKYPQILIIFHCCCFCKLHKKMKICIISTSRYEGGGRWKWNKYNLHQKEKKSPTTLSIERLCVKLCLITIIILVGGRKREEKKCIQDIRSGYRGRHAMRIDRRKLRQQQQWNEKSCILINISFFMITLIWIFMLVIKRKFIQINRKISLHRQRLK